MLSGRSRLACAIAAIVFWQAGALSAEPSARDRIELPDGTEMPEVDFERHVVSLFGRLGCNAAACHGSFQGKGGFRLSLFGQSPQMDFTAITDGRVDPASPEDSMLLAKPSGREKHGGGIRLRPDSWEYGLIRKWIADGAHRTAGRGIVRELNVEPGEILRLSIGQTTGLRVKARFADNELQDVTAFSEFRTRNETVAESDAKGRITARGPGDTSIVISFRGTFVSVPVIVPFQVGQGQFRAVHADNLIDREVNARLTLLGLATSPPAGDEEFLRRATLDVLGILPAPDDVRRFIADVEPDKRLKQIDVLLAHPRRAALWATKMCDITGCNIETMELPESLRPKRAKMWHDWFRHRFAQNMRYDEIVRGVLCATSREGQPIETWIDDEIKLQETAQASFDSNYKLRDSLDLFWRRTGPQGPIVVEDQAELVASAFLGVRLHCARCHQHPYDRWTQDDFAGFANIFSRIQFGSSTQLRTATNERLELRRQARREGRVLPEFPRVQEVFVADTARPLTDAATEIPTVPKALGGPPLAGEADPRHALYHSLTRSDSPFLAKSFVNRLWAKYYGQGLVEPVDAFSAANPATNPRLLERLAEEFVRSNYDVAHMERLILSSQAYQRSAVPTQNNSADRYNVAHAPVRMLMAEVVLDAINAALETVDDFGTDVPRGSQAIELAPNTFTNRSLNELFRILGRGDRKSLCDCDRTTTPSLRQPILLLSDPRILDKIRRGRLARLLEQKQTNEEIIDEFFLATLSRRPDVAERTFTLTQLDQASDRNEALVDIVWALINTREFITNH